MDEKRTATDLDELLQHAGWVKGLAFASLRDAALAEDVSQEVLLKALAGPRRTGRVLRAWLAAVTRNTARNELRGMIRRRKREEKGARNEDEDSSGQSQTDLLQAHRALTLAVEALSPKHRKVIVLRFFKQRAFKQTANTLGTSEGNVRVRLHRALQELRNLMSEGGRDWRSSCLILAPMAAVPVPSISLPTSSKLLLAASLTVLLGEAWWWLDREDSTSQDQQSSVVAQVNPAEMDPFDREGGEDAALNRAPDRIQRESITTPQDSSLAENEFRGMVLADGFPVAGAQVVVGQVDDLTRTTTAEDGSFTVTLKSSARGVVSASFGDRTAMERFDRLELFPDLLLVEEPYEHRNTFVVLDGLTREGLPGARVEVYANWAGAFEDPSFNTRKPDFLVECMTDANGQVPIPVGVPPDVIEFHASAPGYISSWNDGLETTLFPGPELPVQLLDLAGAPLANVEVATGVIPRIVRTDLDGFVPDIRNWQRYGVDGRTVTSPITLMVRLEDGRYWHMGRELLAAHLVEFEGVLQVTVDDTPIQVEVADFDMDAGEYVEVASVNPYWQMWSAASGTRWQRFQAGETSALTTGLVNPDAMIRARLMPNEIVLGTFPVIERKATVLPELLPFKFTLEGPSVKEGKTLTLMVQGDSGSANIPLVNGVAEALIREQDDYYYWVQEEPSEERLFLHHPERPWTHWTQVKPVDGKVEIFAKEFASTIETVRVRVNGEAVVSGHLGFHKIDMHGVGKMPFDSEGRPMANSAGLRLSGVLVSRGPGPTLTSLWIRSDSQWPGTFSRLGNGDRVWDLQLASVELWVPATDSPEPRQFRIPRGGVRTELLYPNEGARSNRMYAPAEGGWFAFRVPAGNYAFKVGEISYGGPEGVDFPAGQITQLHPDVGEDAPPDNQ